MILLKLFYITLKLFYITLLLLVFCRVVNAFHNDTMWSFKVNYGLGVAASAISLEAQSVYTMSKQGVLFSHDIRSGKLLWKFETYINAYTSLVSQPTVLSAADHHLSDSNRCEDLVFVGGIYALDACTGALKWHTVVSGSNYSAPVASPSLLFVNGRSHSGISMLYALHTSSGQHAWNMTLMGAKPTHPVLSNTVLGGLVVTCTIPDLKHTGSENSPNIKDGMIIALNATTGQKLWSWASRHGTAFLSAAVVSTSQESICVATTHPKPEHSVTCLNASTGAVLWTFLVNTRVAASPVIDNEGVFIYFASIGGVLYGLRSTGVEVWSTGLDSAIIAAPVLGIGNGRLYAGTTSGKLFAVNKSSGNIVGIYDSLSAIMAPPLVGLLESNSLIVASSGGIVALVDGGFGFREDYVEPTHSPTPSPTLVDPNPKGKIKKPKVSSAPTSIKKTVVDLTPVKTDLDTVKGVGCGDNNDVDKEGGGVEESIDIEENDETLYIILGVSCFCFIAILIYFVYYDNKDNSTCSSYILYWWQRLQRMYYSSGHTGAIATSHGLDLVPLISQSNGTDTRSLLQQRCLETRVDRRKDLAFASVT